MREVGVRDHMSVMRHYFGLSPPSPIVPSSASPRISIPIQIIFKLDRPPRLPLPTRPPSLILIPTHPFPFPVPPSSLSLAPPIRIHSLFLDLTFLPFSFLFFTTPLLPLPIHLTNPSMCTTVLIDLGMQVPHIVDRHLKIIYRRPDPLCPLRQRFVHLALLMRWRVIDEIR